jgi:hypothetical protein
VILPRALVNETQFESAVSEVERMLRPEVVRVRYELGDDSTGEPSVFFRILLSDPASRREQLGYVASRISTEIVRRIEPLEQWGVLPYFTFRSQSEQAQLQDPAWA